MKHVIIAIYNYSTVISCYDDITNLQDYDEIEIYWDDSIRAAREWRRTIPRNTLDIHIELCNTNSKRKEDVR